MVWVLGIAAAVAFFASGALVARATLDDENDGNSDGDRARLVVPGAPDRSLVLHRMNKLGLGRMPHVASNVVDPEGVALVREWIEKMSR